MYKWPHRIDAIGANGILTVLTDQERTLVKCRRRISVVMKYNVRVMLNLCLTVYLAEWLLPVDWQQRFYVKMAAAS